MFSKLNNNKGFFDGFLAMIAASIIIGEICVAGGVCTKPSKHDDTGAVSNPYSSSDLSFGSSDKTSAEILASVEHLR